VSELGLPRSEQEIAVTHDAGEHGRGVLIEACRVYGRCLAAFNAGN
jgi:hypothetical protein